jgi:hypothetical protein
MDEPATDDDGAGKCQPERHQQPPALGAPAQLAVLVAPGISAATGDATGLDHYRALSAC